MKKYIILFIVLFVLWISDLLSKNKNRILW